MPRRLPRGVRQSWGVARAEALELAGVDFMTVSPAVWEQLNEAATLQGYNDGFTASSGESGLQQRLSPEVAPLTLAQSHRTPAVRLRAPCYTWDNPPPVCKPLCQLRSGFNASRMVCNPHGAATFVQAAAAYAFDDQELATVTEESFKAGLGSVGLELLDDGIKGLQDSVERLSTMLSSIAIDAE